MKIKVTSKQLWLEAENDEERTRLAAVRDRFILHGFEFTDEPTGISVVKTLKIDLIEQDRNPREWF